METSRRTFLKTIGIATAAAGMNGLGCRNASHDSAVERAFAPRYTTAKGDKLNIVLIMTDDMGYECLSCYGSKTYKTPNLDSLAQRGVRFTNCHSTPLCTPSRVKIMTGKYNFRNYVEFAILKPGEKTFAHLLQDNGYATCCAGKWQLNARYEGQLPDEAGFDEHCLWQVNILGSRYHDPTYTLNGKHVEDLQGKYGPDVFTNFCLNFMERKRDRPFLVYYPMCLPHAPFQPTPDCPEWPEDRTMQDRRFYKDMVEYMDKLVGRFEKKLEELGIAEKTVIIFTSDNGTPRGITSETDRRLVSGGKGSTCNGGTHVPLIAYWKNHNSGYDYVCPDLVDFTDILPTLADAAGVDIPGGWQIDGKSFMPQIAGLAAEWRDSFFSYYNPKIRGKWDTIKWVRGSRFKLYDDGRFYDIQYDILERRPLNTQEQDEMIKRRRNEFQKILDKYKDVRSPYLYTESAKQHRRDLEKEYNFKTPVQ